MKCRAHPIVDEFLKSLRKLPRHERDEAVGQIGGFVASYSMHAESEWQKLAFVDGDGAFSRHGWLIMAEMLNDVGARLSADSKGAN